jgi:hypothetical protein
MKRIPSNAFRARSFSLLTAGACLLSMNAAHAQLSALGGLASSIGGMLASTANPMAGGDAYDVDGFVRRSAELSEIAGRSVTAINAAFASEEQLTAKRAALSAIAHWPTPGNAHPATAPCTKPRPAKRSACWNPATWKSAWPRWMAKRRS